MIKRHIHPLWRDSNTRQDNKHLFLGVQHWTNAMEREEIWPERSNEHRMAGKREKQRGDSGSVMIMQCAYIWYAMEHGTAPARRGSVEAPNTTDLCLCRACLHAAVQLDAKPIRAEPSHQSNSERDQTAHCQRENAHAIYDDEESAEH